MTMNISTLLPSQLPEYIRSDPSYSNFIIFLQAYYEWMEQNSDVNNTNVLYNSKNLLDYNDIDTTTDEFLKYYINDFLQYFPKDSLISERLAIKTAKELYRSKGTPASYQFLFRVLYNSDFDAFYTKDVVIKASDGIWYVPKSIKLLTTDLSFLNVKNLRVFGERSKSIATIENCLFTGNKIELFLSDIERFFSSSEMVRIVDSNNQDVYVLNSEIVQKDQNGNYPNGAYRLRAKISGGVSQINIDPNNRGLYYKPGDPVVIYDGLSESIANPTRASAQVGTTTSGSITQINVVNGGFGYGMYPNTTINITNAPGAIATVSSLTSQLPPTPYIVNGGTGYAVNDIIIKGNNQSYFAFADVTAVNKLTGAITEITYRSGLASNAIFGITANVISSNVHASNAVINISSLPGVGIANVTNVVNDTISLKVTETHVGHAPGFLLGSSTNYPLGNISPSAVSYKFAKMFTANVDTKLSDAFTFDSFTTYSISSILVENGGTGISKLPEISATSTYTTDVYDANNSANTITASLSNIGILAPIQIVNPGVGYRANDRIIFSGGTGYGANAIISQVSSSGGILAINFTYPNANIIQYPLGGMGYRQTLLPTLSINSANGSAYGAIITVPGILGAGAEFSVSADKIGTIKTIDLLSYGEDYTSQPKVSLVVSDILVYNFSPEFPQNGDIIYQQISVDNSVYFATVDSISKASFNNINQSQTLYSLRTFNFNSQPDPSLPLYIKNKNITLTMANTAYAADALYPGSPEYNINGTIIYGDGNAKAAAKFTNGLVIGSGQYLNTQGQPSSFSVLQSEIYNNYTYQITVEKEICKYRDILLKLLHPTGMRMLGRYSLRSNTDAKISSEDALLFAHTLPYYTGSQSTTATITADFVNKSNNIVKFSNLSSANLATFIFSNSTIQFTSTNGDIVKSEVASVNPSANTVTLQNNVWLTFANVATISANSGSNTISVLSLTGSYDIINNGNYANSAYPLMDIVRAGDKILISNNTVKSVSSVDYSNNIIKLTTNLTGNTINTLLSVNRTFVASDGSILVYGPTGQQYIPEITDENGNSITTESNTIIILG